MRLPWTTFTFHNNFKSGNLKLFLPFISIGFVCHRLIVFFQNVAIMEWQSVFLCKNGDDVPYDEDIWLHGPNYNFHRLC